MIDAEDIKAVNAGLGVAILLAAGDIKPKPTDLATMYAARDAFARIRGAGIAEAATTMMERTWQCRRDPSHPLLSGAKEPRCSVCGDRCEPY